MLLRLVLEITFVSANAPIEGQLMVCNIHLKALIVFNFDISTKQKLHGHTEASVKCREPGIQKLAANYNNLCVQMAALICQGKAPHGSIAPLPISKDELFKLDVDDDVWQNVGLEDSINGLSPAWLAEERVRSGIKYLLELRHCEEEETCLLRERKALTEWFTEEWSWLQNAKVAAGKEFHHILVHM